MRESFYNSLIVGGMSVALSSIFALPLAYFITRFQFRGAILIQTLGVLPLIMPPFVGATAMQLLFGRSGSLNLILGDWFGINLPIMEGLNAVIFVEALHYFPFILLNLTVALNNIDSAMEESAQNLGASGFRLFRRIVFPLAHAGLHGRRGAGVPQGVRRRRDAARAQRHQHPRRAGLLPHHVDRHRRPDRLRRERDHGRSPRSLALWGSTWVMRGKEYATLQRGGSIARHQAA